MFFTDENDRPLLLRAAGQPKVWQFPGGGAEKSEFPFETAVREAKEETGISFEGSPRLLAVRFQSSRPAWPINMLGVIFDGGRLSPEQLDGIVLDREEHTEFDLRSLAGWRNTLSERRYAQLEQLLSARDGGDAAYLLG
ncbi:NUDIX domain-containing protein [Streptomyces sp. NPDC058409]|uniref:NUDIX domain-containing protein n=1 Tax=Streptomyces sp. NPDC058409 TaxID=3346484 RepID=UPI00365FFDFB